MDITKTLSGLLSIREEIHNYFGYKEDWVTIPLSDETEKYWMIIAQDTKEGIGGGKIVYSDVPFTEEVIQEGMKIYIGRIYTQRFLPKFIYRSDDGKSTMITVDTQTDGNRYLMIFLNEKECKDPEMIKAYLQSW